MSEVIATFGLIATILACRRFKPATTPTAVCLYITSGYWFTASTAFANPAVTLSRSFSDTFAGIALPFVLPFIVAQLVGAAIATLSVGWLLEETPRHAV